MVTVIQQLTVIQQPPCFAVGVPIFRGFFWTLEAQSVMSVMFLPEQLPRFKIEWGEPFSGILASLDLFAFDLDLISISCSARFQALGLSRLFRACGVCGDGASGLGALRMRYRVHWFTYFDACAKTRTHSKES